MEHSEVLLLRELVLEKGHFIRWTGQSASGKFYVILQSPTGGIVKRECRPSLWRTSSAKEKKLVFKEADGDPSYIVPV